MKNSDRLLKAFVESYRAGESTVDESCLLFGSACDEVEEMAQVRILQAKSQLDFLFRLLVDDATDAGDIELGKIFRMLAATLVQVMYYTGKTRKAKKLNGRL